MKKDKFATSSLGNGEKYTIFAKTDIAAAGGNGYNGYKVKKERIV